MNFAEHWYELQRMNPGLCHPEESKMTISIDAFRKALARAFSVGFDHGTSMKQRLEQAFGAGFKEGVDSKSLFEQLFGK